jgi:flagellar hook-associated protein 3 FlgL
MRLSTTTMYDLGVSAITDQQASLSKTQQQISTGRRILTPADDPIGAAQVLDLSQADAANTQYTANRTIAKNSLGLADNALSSAGNVLQNVNQLLVEAGNASLDDQQRGYIASELQGNLQELLGVANSTDGSGNYLFSGGQISVKPYALGAGGAYTYSGDQNVRAVQASPTRQIPVSAAGSEVFDRIKTGNGVFTTSAAAANTGTGLVTVGSVTQPSQLTGHNYSVAFAVDPTTGATTYSVIDNTSANPALPTNVAYTSGAGIAFDGLQFEISGAPANGDSFTVAPSANQSIFQTIQNAITLLQTPTAGTPGTGNTRLANGLSAANQGVANALDNLLKVRAQVGSSAKEIDTLDSVGQSLALQYKTTLSNVQDVDYAKAASDLAQEQVTLQAAQKAFVSSEGLTLFQYIQ